MKYRIWIFALAAAAAMLLSGCTEEKAKALKLAAETFNTEAELACRMGLDSLNASVAMSPLTREEIAEKINTTSFNDHLLQLIYDGPGAAGPLGQTAQALDRICLANRKLAAMYTDLPGGYLLSTEDVKDAQKLVVNVVVRFANLARIFANNPTVGRDNVARIKIIEAQQEAMKVKDEKARAQLLDTIAAQIEAGRVAESDNRARVLNQFSKAVGAGEVLIQFSERYDRMDASSMLDLLRDFTGLYGGITGRAEVAQRALARVDAAEQRIKTDPLLSPLLESDLKN